METLAIWPAADYNRCCISITESTADIVGYERCGAMAVKTDTEVIIGGRVLTLSGYESEEYLQKVASYINNKLTEYNRVDSFRRQPAEMQHILLELNIADDYFKAKKQIDGMEEDAQAREKELYDLKHELISAQIKLENAEKELAKMKEENNDLQMQIVKLETEMKNRRR